jgi:glutathione S-transferase
MLTLYHAPQSRSTRIIWLLEELGAEYNLIYTNIPRMDGSGGPDENNPHPDKKVPALAHNGALITESAAIVLYLTDLFPQKEIGRAVGDPNRGPYLTWLAYYAGVMEPVGAFHFLGLGDNAGLVRTFRSRADLDRRILSALQKHEYIVDNRFSGADILVASAGQFARELLPAGDVVDAYLKRCSERPALRAVLTKDARPAG